MGRLKLERMNLRAAQFWPTLAAVLVIALTLSLGRWQLERASTKEERAESYARLSRQPPIHVGVRPLDADALKYRQVAAKGEWLTEYGIFLDNQVLKGEVGYYVLMPLRLEGSDMSILVNRGWIGVGSDRKHLPEINSQRGVIEVNGIAQSPSEHFKELGPVYREGRIWENLTIQRFSAWSGLKLQPVVIWQTDHAEDGLARVTVSPDSGADRNYGYAFQWFLMAAITGFLWAYYFFKKDSRDVE